MSRWTQADLEAYSSRVKQLRTGAAPMPVPRPTVSSKAANNALGRMPLGHMNKTETLYALELEMRKHAGEIVWYRFEGMRLRLAAKTTYTPDFSVLLSTGELQLHEVKGHWRDDARVKIKVAAELYPFKFIAVTKRTQKSGGGWSIEEF